MLNELHNCHVSQDFLEGFPLKKYGFVFEARLNAEDSWESKVVCSVLKDGAERFVSATFPDEQRYLKFLKVSSLLKECGMLHPEIFQTFEKEKTVICNYMGDFLPSLLLSEHAYRAIDAVLGYLALLDTVFPKNEIFELPPILREFFELSDRFPQVVPFISETKGVLPRLKERGICFYYGSGIEDPDIKNFRIIREDGRFQALTTDYDHWSDKVNRDWAIGYFYASLRWLAKVSPEASKECGEYILRTINVDDAKEEFMFWLGVLSGYCGYRRKLQEFIVENRMDVLHYRLEIIMELDEKVSHLANRLIEAEAKEIANRDDLYLPPY